MSDWDLYGDADANNGASGGADQDTSAGDGLPGYSVDGHPGWRSGAFGSARNVLGLIRVSNPIVRGGDASMPLAYMPDGHGGVKLRPEFAAPHPKGPFDFGGMAKEIHWPGVAEDLGKIGAGVIAAVSAPFALSALGLGAASAEAVGAAGSGATPNPWITGGLFGWRTARTLHNQNKANPKNADPVVKSDVDEASNGLP